MKIKITQYKMNLTVLKIFVFVTFVILMPCLLFSKTTNAITLNSQVQLDRIIIGKGDVRCVINGQTINGASQSGECSFTPASTSTGNLNVVQQIYNNQDLTLKKGDMLEFFVGVKSLRAGSSHNIVWTAQTYDYFSLVDMEKVSEDEYNRFCITYNPSNVPSGSYTCATNSSGYSNFYRFVLMANRDLENVKGGLGYYTTSRSTLFVSDTIQPFIIYMSDIFIYKKGDDLDVAEQQTQEASDEGETNANQSETDNETASQNVIGLVSEIVQVFYTPAGNCNLDVDLGNIDLGVLNLCSGKPAEFAQIINLAGSIIIVYACYRVARTIFRLWVAMSIFGQGGSKGDQ